MRKNKDLEELRELGELSQYPQNYSPQSLDAIPNHHRALAWTSFICTEFTSLCPKTNQPDFARIYINYLADKKMVESKSLKIYLFSFRNHGDFHEDCVQKICDDLSNLIHPHYLEVIGEFTPRGGISIFPYSQYSSEKDFFKKMQEERLINYAPGKYSMELQKIY